jgi:hypothetical protein
MLLVSSMLFERFLKVIRNSQPRSGAAMTIMRILRALKLVRLMRIIRILRLIPELRVLLRSVMGSLSALCWAMVLLTVWMYVIGTALTQLVLYHRLEHPETNWEEHDLIVCWGTIGQTMLTLFQSLTGGIDWNDALSPLREEISMLLTPLFMLFIAFGSLCMLNIITGVFVESAMIAGSQDKDAHIVSDVRKIFGNAELEDADGYMTYTEFLHICNTEEMQSIFKQIDMDRTEAEGLFTLLDGNGNGRIDVDEFVNGVVGLRGPAKSLDLTLLIREMSQFVDKQMRFTKRVEDSLTRLDQAVGTEDQVLAITRRGRGSTS